MRLFVALELPDRTRSGIAAWGARELVDPALRPVPAANLHLTLAFLGQRGEREIGAIATVVGESVGPAPLIELRDPVTRPPRRGRVHALPAISPGAELLQAGLRDRLVEAGFYRPEKRPFWPHVTVARVRSEGRGSLRPAAVERSPGELPAGLKEPFHGVRLSLYRSELKPAGARYVPLAQFELPGAGGG